MKTSTILSLGLSASLTCAAPSPIQKREVGGILICNGANATGSCEYNVYQMETCYNLTDPYYNNAATFAPDGEEFYCYPYPGHCGDICTSPTGCTFGGVSYNSTFKYNLTSIEWNTLIGHFECHLGHYTNPYGGPN